MAPFQVRSDAGVAADGKTPNVSEAHDPKVCRFCLGDEINDGGEFVQPCPCRGSAKYVHMECLCHGFVARGEWHNFRCPTCQQPYTGRGLQALAQLSAARMAEKHGKDAPQ